MVSSFAVGSRLTVEIRDIAFGGEGVARVDDFVIFVPGVLTGETVEIELVEVKKRFGRARLLQVTRPSTDRVQPGCRYFGECGGCQYQHIRYETQLQIKHKQIADLFQRVGGFPEAVIDPVLSCPQPYGYRNRMMVRSYWDKQEERLRVGFLRAESRVVVDVEECRIAEPAINEQIRLVRTNPPPRGGLKVVVRIAPEGWDVPRDSFFQNNFFLLPRLVETVRERLRNHGARFLVDAYCGVGFFGIETAGVVERFVGVELDQMAIRAARRNLVMRGITNGEFLAGATEALLPSLLERFTPERTAVVLDPPRVGCAPGTIEALRRSRPGQVIYISCHPATLARDLSVLCTDGLYRLERVTPLDMFPQTQHVECVADVRLVTSAVNPPGSPVPG